MAWELPLDVPDAGLDPGKLTRVISVWELRGWLPRRLSAQFRIPCQGNRQRFDPWVRKIPWRRKWQPTLVG